jgi:hypothetical protein
MVPDQLGAAGLEDAPAEVLGGAGEEVLRRSRSDGKYRSRKSREVTDQKCWNVHCRRRSLGVVVSEVLGGDGSELLGIPWKGWE